MQQAGLQKLLDEEAHASSRVENGSRLQARWGKRGQAEGTVSKALKYPASQMNARSAGHPRRCAWCGL